MALHSHSVVSAIVRPGRSAKISGLCGPFDRHAFRHEVRSHKYRLVVSFVDDDTNPRTFQMIYNNCDSVFRSTNEILVAIWPPRERRSVGRRLMMIIINKRAN